MQIPKFFDPDELSRSLLQVSLYLTAWETLRSSIIEQVKGFYSDNWTIDEQGKLKGVATPRYKKDVIKLHPKDEMHACCLWLKSMEALNDDDIASIAEIRRHRNSIGHEIVDYITRDDTSVSRDAIFSILMIVKKIDTWWLAEIELQTQPDVSDELYDAAKRGDAVGGYSFLLELILPIFDGDFEILANLNELFKDGHGEGGNATDGTP